MNFWIFMLIMNILIPCTMIGLGHYFAKTAPKNINPLFGYRSTLSMKNKETWEFAHHYSGRLWRMTGWPLLIMSVFAMLFLIGKTEDVVGTYGGILCGIQLVFLIGAIVPTEIALKKTFDEGGIRRK